MQYKLLKHSANNLHDIIGTTLFNRGITNIKQYITASQNEISDYHDLNNIAEAVECLMRHLNGGGLVCILSDTDV